MALKISIIDKQYAYQNMTEMRSLDAAQVAQTSVPQEMRKQWFVLKHKKDLNRVEFYSVKNVLRDTKGQH